MASSRGRISQEWKSQKSVESQVRVSVIAQGPPLAFFASCVIGDILYIHGGVRTRADRSPTNRMFTFQGTSWREITTDDSPALSYHRCVVMGDGQFIVTIGGWDGSKRKSDIYIYDVKNGSWSTTFAPGFPSDGGLNNHAVLPFKRSTTTFLIMGRDGSLRIQRKHGDAYCLHADPWKKQFRWEQYPIHVDSRSGHSLIAYGSSVFVIGGRGDHLMQRYAGLPLENLNVCQSLYADLKQLLESSAIVPMKKLPSTRKDHSSIICGNDMAIVYGGETFDGKSRDPSADVFLVTLTSPQQWYHLGSLEFGRLGHTMIEVGNRLIVHGGLGKDGVCGETFQIEITR